MYTYKRYKNNKHAYVYIYTYIHIYIHTYVIGCKFKIIYFYESLFHSFHFPIDEYKRRWNALLQLCNSWKENGKERCLANYIHIYIYTYTHTYMHTCTRLYIHTYIYTYIHTYTCIHIHTYIYTTGKWNNFILFLWELVSIFPIYSLQTNHTKGDETHCSNCSIREREYINLLCTR